MGFLPKETPGQQAANARVRKGTKRPEHGPWPTGKMNSAEKALNKMAGKGNVLKGQNIEGKK